MLPLRQLLRMSANAKFVGIQCHDLNNPRREGKRIMLACELTLAGEAVFQPSPRLCQRPRLRKISCMSFMSSSDPAADFEEAFAPFLAAFALTAFALTGACVLGCVSVSRALVPVGPAVPRAP